MEGYAKMDDDEVPNHAAFRRTCILYFSTLCLCFVLGIFFGQWLVVVGAHGLVRDACASSQRCLPTQPWGAFRCHEGDKETRAGFDCSAAGALSTLTARACWVNFLFIIDPHNLCNRTSLF